MRLLTAAVAITGPLALGGCGDGDSNGSGDGTPSAGAVLPGGGLSVAEAIATDAEPPLAVSGWVVGSGDDARLCSRYTPDADEPCGEPSLALAGEVDAESGEQVSVLGAVKDHTFVVASNVR